MDVKELQAAVKNANFAWRKHILIRLAERNIAQDKVLEVVLSGEVIEHYPKDKPFASCLMFKIIQGEPYHVAVSFDSERKKAYIITAYHPGLDKFEPDFKTRRK